MHVLWKQIKPWAWVSISPKFINFVFISVLATTAPLEDVGPKFIEDLPATFAYTNVVGGKLTCKATGDPKPSIQWLNSDFLPVINSSVQVKFTRILDPPTTHLKTWFTKSSELHPVLRVHSNNVSSTRIMRIAGISSYINSHIWDANIRNYESLGWHFAAA